MSIEYNKNYILSSLALFTTSIGIYYLCKNNKIPALPCTSIEEENKEEDNN